MRAAAETPVSATVPVNAQAAGTVYVPVTVVPQLNVQSASATVAATSGGTGSATVTVGGVQKKANGGLVDSAELTWVGDEGYPEMIIPFAPHRRSRALELLSQTEDALGISKHANGGVVGGMLPSSKSDGENGNSDAKPKSGGNGSVSVGMYLRSRAEHRRLQRSLRMPWQMRLNRHMRTHRMQQANRR